MNPVRTHFWPIPVLPAVIVQGDSCVDLSVWDQLKRVPWAVVDGPGIFRLNMNVDTPIRVNLTNSAPSTVEIIGDDEVAGVACFACREFGNRFCAGANEYRYAQAEYLNFGPRKQLFMSPHS